MYTLLQSVAYPRPAGFGSPFYKVLVGWDSVARTYVRTQAEASDDTYFELPIDTELQRYEVRVGLTRVVKYAGQGQVYTTNITNGNPGGGGGSVGLIAQFSLSTTFVSAASQADASIDATGAQGLPPYDLQLAGTEGAAVGYSQAGRSISANYFCRFQNLPAGRLRLTVTDATGATATADLVVTVGNGAGRGIVLQDSYSGDSQNGQGTQYLYLFNDNSVQQLTYTGGGNDGDYSAVPAGDQIDQFLLRDGHTLRKYYTDGQAGPDVYFTDEDLGQAQAGDSELELDNLIPFDPDSVAEANGGVLLEMNATALPLTFTLGNATNQTGSFDGLGPIDDKVLVTDAVGNTLEVPISLAVRYAPRWQLVFDDLFGVPARVELWLKGYTGPVENICAQGTPVILKSDGLNNSLGGQGDIPPVIGRSAELNWLVPIDTFADVVAGIQATDRYCRCDVYYAGKLDFRGFVQPSIYEAPLRSGKQTIKMVATDGIGLLKSTNFASHVGQRLNGHRPWLNTLLHCLARCSISLPTLWFTNRRDATMATSDAPELAATTNRTGYWDEDKNEPQNCRYVVDALMQAAGGTLCQREGTWQIRSALEAPKDAPGRAYLPAGTGQPAVVALSPSGTIIPPNTAPAYWHWLQGDQAMQMRAGWKSLTGQTDTDYLKNAYPAGKVFSDPYAWVENQTGLRATSRWKPGPGQVFPLVLGQTGQKSSDYSTQWPRSSATNVADARYLQGPALPLVPGSEAVPAYLSVTAKLVASETYRTQQGGQAASPTTAAKALLPYEVLADGLSFMTGTLEITGSGPAPIPLLALPSGTKQAKLRLGAWYAPDTNLYTLSPAFEFGSEIKAGDVRKHAYGGQGPVLLYVAILPQAANGGGTGVAPGGPGTNPFWAEISPTNQATGTLLVSEVVVQLRPQEATWDGEDNFRADNPAGTVRPTDVLQVTHADVPIQAGLFSGNLFAFGKAVGLADGTMSTRWARAVDKKAAPLFEANVLDGGALRATPSRLLTGTVRFRGLGPPRLLDSLDAPTDTPGRRYFVLSDAWDVHAAQTSIAVAEIGLGAAITDPLLDLPAGVRVTHQVYAYQPGRFTPYARRVHGGGVRVRHA